MATNNGFDLKNLKNDSKLVLNKRYRKMMINREIIKREIDKVDDKYLVKLYKIIKTFEEPDDPELLEVDISDCGTRKRKWKKFIEKYSGSLADTPIKRGEQGSYEVREELE